MQYLKRILEYEFNIFSKSTSSGGEPKTSLGRQFLCFVSLLMEIATYSPSVISKEGATAQFFLASSEAAGAGSERIHLVAALTECN